MNQMEDEDIQDMAYRIAELLKENSIDARRAEPILWMLLSNVYRLLKKKDGISTRSIGSIIEDNKKVVLRESCPLDLCPLDFRRISELCIS
jgi:hypothetical protein